MIIYAEMYKADLYQFFCNIDDNRQAKYFIY